MADRKIFDRLRQNTTDFKATLKEQLATLEKLKGVGETLKEMTDEADPFTDVIQDTMDAVSGMEKIVAKLDSLQPPKV